MKIKILESWGKETNPAADSYKSRDGGGYFQPAGGALIETEMGLFEVSLIDQDLGWYGAYRQWELTVCATGQHWQWWSGSCSQLDGYDPSRVLAELSDATGCDPQEIMQIMQATRKAVHVAAYGAVRK